MSVLAADQDFIAVAKTVFGDSLDLEDLAKSVDAADVHVDGPVQAAQSQRHRRKLAAGLLAGAGIEALAAKDTIGPLKAGIKAVKPAYRAATTARGKAKALKPLAVGERGKVFPVTRGPGTSAALQGGNFVVGLGAAKELIKPKDQVKKGLPIKVRPVNPTALVKPPTLKARKPAASPAFSTAVSKRDVEGTFEISKVNSEKRQVFGWANVSVWQGQPVRDRQGDEIDIEELEKAAYDFVLDSRLGGDQHERIVKFAGAPKHTSTLIESMVFTPEKIEKMGLPADFPQAWWTGWQVHDPQVWNDIKAGKRTGFSVHGTGRREPIEKAADPNRDPRRERAQRDFDAHMAEGLRHPALSAGDHDHVPLRAVRRGGKAKVLLPVAAAAAAGGAVAAHHRKVSKADHERAKKVLTEGHGVRVRQAIKPPPVKREAVDSSAMSSLGYQRQTRRLSVEMKSRPGEPYEYRVSPHTAREVVGAKSKGQAYTQHVRGKAKRVEPGKGYTVADRARLFVSPQDPS